MNLDWQVILQDIEMAVPLILAILKQINPPASAPVTGLNANNPTHTLHVVRNADGTVTVKHSVQ